jgi:YaiO family outer membrane protein
MIEVYPGNQDLLLFQARVLAWKGDYDGADSGFRGVLAKEPENRRAMIGRAEIASWKKEFASAKQKYQEILMLDPNDPDIHFRIGRIHLWEGNYSQARQYYKKACELDPDNAEYRGALKNAHPEFTNTYELRYQFQNQGFSDERGHYTDHHLVFSLKISPDIGPLHLKYNQTHRYHEQDSLFGIEFYPHLWKKAYGYIDIHFSPKAVHYPSSSYHFEVYQSFLKAAEISLGYRRMYFENEATSVYLGSVGFYIGNYYPFVRLYYTPEDRGTTFSWFVNVRRYFTKDNYLALGYGQGSRPFDIITFEDILVRKSWIFLAEWNWYFLNRIHFKILFTHRNEKDGPTRNSIFLATGYRW